MDLFANLKPIKAGKLPKKAKFSELCDDPYIVLYLLMKLPGGMYIELNAADRVYLVEGDNYLTEGDAYHIGISKADLDAVMIGKQASGDEMKYEGKFGGGIEVEMTVIFDKYQE